MSMDERYVGYLNGAVGYNEDRPTLTLGNVRHQLRYMPGYRCKPGIHIGQRKLCVSEIDFLTRHVGSLDERRYVLYAGAAPSNHIGLIQLMFPNLIFILVDPNPFKIILRPLGIQSNIIEYLVSRRNALGPDTIMERLRNPGDKRLFIIQDYMTNMYAELFSSLRPLFISDIRTNTSDMPTDLDILHDSALQYNWVHIGGFPAFMLKFRTPFMSPGSTISIPDNIMDVFRIAKGFDDKIDFLGDYTSGRFRYLKGTVNLQAWAKVSSTETRLIGYGDDLGIKNYPIRPYENLLFYYNCVDRGFIYKQNPYADPEFGFDHCNSCAIEANAWQNYYMKYNIQPNIRRELRYMSIATGNRTLKTGGHGYFYSIDPQRILNTIQPCVAMIPNIDQLNI